MHSKLRQNVRELPKFNTRGTKAPAQVRSEPHRSRAGPVQALCRPCTGSVQGLCRPRAVPVQNRGTYMSHPSLRLSVKLACEYFINFWTWTSWHNLLGCQF